MINELISNENLAEHLAKQGFDMLCKQYTQATPEMILDILERLDSFVALHGTGIDLGSGPGIVSGTLAKLPQVRKIYSVELASSCVDLCHPVVRSALGIPVEKMDSIIGDFDNLPDFGELADFTIIWESLHHSNNPVHTLRQLRCSIAVGGMVFVVDRAHDNSTTEAQLNAMLDIRYGEKFLRDNFMDTLTKLTRRDLGEHEYRYGDWERFIHEAGYQVVEKLVLSKEGTTSLNDAGWREVGVNYEMMGNITKKIVMVIQPNP